MSQKPLTINLDQKTYKDIHKIRDMIIEADGIIIFRMTEASSKQAFYREVLRAGIKSKLLSFAKKEQEIKYENTDKD